MPKSRLFYQPLKPWRLFQGFGENQACVDNATNSKVILCDGLNPPDGYRSLYGPAGHTGLDLGALHGQEVYCSQKGIVDTIDTNPKSGLDVRIVSISDDGIQYRHIYEHLLGYQAKVGEIIETGQLVGWCDNTGYSSGDHLHWQLEQLIDNKWVPIDPIPLMADVYAKDILAINHTLKYIAEQIALLADNIANWLRSGKGRAI